MRGAIPTLPHTQRDSCTIYITYFFCSKRDYAP